MIIYSFYSDMYDNMKKELLTSNFNFLLTRNDADLTVAEVKTEPS